jgi:hypothetical protein
MTLDWCAGIRDACAHWRDAPMLQHTFEALEASLESESDASIDAAKGLVECICRIVIDQLDDSTAPLKPRDDAPITEWVSAATRVLRRGDVRDRKFADLIKHHNGLAESLRVLRNDAGPLSHGKNGFIQALTVYHQRAAILAADAIVTFLHTAYLDAQLDPISSREPWDRFAQENALIDAYVGLTVDADDGASPILRFQLPGGDELPITIEVSRLLYQLDREAYVEALNAARGAPVSEVGSIEEQGEQ